MKIKLIRENLESISERHHRDAHSDHGVIEEVSSSLIECRRAFQTAVDLIQSSKRVSPAKKQLFLMEADFFATTVQDGTVSMDIPL